ncbi:MAG: hypothetical protein AB7V56_13840 [Candidatus Nitrosocosmicus sp.]
MSILKNPYLKKVTTGQFTCAFWAKHVISPKEEERLYESKEKRINSFCNRCGISLVVKIDEDDQNKYTLSRKVY